MLRHDARQEDLQVLVVAVEGIHVAARSFGAAESGELDRVRGNAAGGPGAPALLVAVGVSAEPVNEDEGRPRRLRVPPAKEDHVRLPGALAGAYDPIHGPSFRD